MTRLQRWLSAATAAAAFLAAALAAPAWALPPETLRSVVSVLPVWPGMPQGGGGAKPGVAPEGSGVAIGAGGLIATAWHVVEPAERIDVRLFDGRVLPARLAGHDVATDIALLRIDEGLPALDRAPEPLLASPVCAIGNSFGLGLSASCGVVSALHVSRAGFNPVEDFVQTDAAVNPGDSGGALVDGDGRLVGMLSAIFASEGDGDLGVNFAVSATLLDRVVDDLLDDGAVDYVSAGWRLVRPSRAQLSLAAGALVAEIDAMGAAARAGIETGDLITRIGARAVRRPRDAVGALALTRRGETVEVAFLRDGAQRRAVLSFAPNAVAAAAPPAVDPTCPHPPAVCLARQAVFPVSSFDPLASSVRIAPDLLVTNRHAIGDRLEATVQTPEGPRSARVVASAYRGDLVLLTFGGLRRKGVVLAPYEGAVGEGPFFAVGADAARREVRVFEPGGLILGPAEGAPLGRLHVAAAMQPGVSGGALVDAEGRLVGIAVGGGQGRFEALPASAINELLALRDATDAEAVQESLGASFVGCANAIDAGRTDDLAETCAASENAGMLLEAGRALAAAGDFDAAIGLHRAAAEQVPNSINARLSLLVSLQLGGRFADMPENARWLFEQAPEDPQALRFAIQSGVWGGDPALAEAAYQTLLSVDPRQAQAARRFIDNAPPAPQPR